MNIISHEMTTMSSREIAELTGKRHDNVLADIRKMLAEIQSPEKLGDYQDGRGRTQHLLLLDKEETICLVSGYSAALRMRIIRRWSELEELTKKPALPSNCVAVDKDEYIATLKFAFDSVNRQRDDAIRMLEEHKKLAEKEMSYERGLMDAVLTHIRDVMHPASRDNVAASRKRIRKPDGRIPLKREIVSAFDRLIETGELLERREGFYDVQRPEGFYDF